MNRDSQKRNINIVNSISHFLAGSTKRPTFLPSMTFSGNIIVPDVSFYQDNNDTPQKIDFVKMKAAGAQGVIIRAGQGGWNDEDFIDYWKAAKGILPRGVYFFMDDRYTPQSQAARLVGLIQSDMPEMEINIDYEIDYGGKYGGWQNLKVLIKEAQRLLTLQSKTFEIQLYTGYYYWLDHSPNPLTQTADLNWFGQFRLWLAWYTTDPAIVKIPKPWTRVDLWQYTSKGTGYGVESLNIDLSKFNGTQAEYNERYHLAPVEPPPPPPPSEYETVKITNVTQMADGSFEIEMEINGLVYVRVWSPVIVPPPPPPPVEPPPVGNFWRVAAERWAELHGQPQPPSGGPLVQVLSSSTKGGKYISPLDASWQAFIRRFNTPATMEKINSSGYGPSQGIDPNSGKLKWNYLCWPSNKETNNYVKVVATSGEWSQIETIPVSGNLSLYAPATHPWLFHKVCDNKGNPVLVNGAPIICPLIGAAKWVPSRALIKVV